MKAEQIVILMVKEEAYLLRHFQLNGLGNPCVDWVLLIKASFHENNLMFLCHVDIFCHLEHSRLLPGGSCLLADCQLHKIV